MMTWYSSFYGDWKDGNSVSRLACSHSRKYIFEQAQKFADETGNTVTVLAEKGMKTWSYEIKPGAER